jgi:hypothetical protein
VRGNILFQSIQSGPELFVLFGNLDIIKKIKIFLRLSSVPKENIRVQESFSAILEKMTPEFELNIACSGEDINQVQRKVKNLRKIGKLGKVSYLVY